MDIITFKINGRDHVCERNRIISYLMDMGEDIQELDLSRCNLDEIPRFPNEEIFHSIRRLNLSYNNIRGLRYGAVVFLRNLLELDLSNNHIIGRIPDDMFIMNLNLVSINLSYNHLVMLSPEVFNQHIQTIDISFNGFTQPMVDAIITRFRNAGYRCNIVSVGDAPIPPIPGVVVRRVRRHRDGDGYEEIRERNFRVIDPQLQFLINWVRDQETDIVPDSP